MIKMSTFSLDGRGVWGWMNICIGMAESLCCPSGTINMVNWLFSSVTQLCRTLCNPTDCSTPGLPVQHQLPGAYSNSCPSSWWCHPTILSSVVPFSHLQSFPASGSFPVSQLFASGGQSIGVSAFASVLPMNIQDWSPLGWTGWISSQSKGLSRVFSSTTVQKHQLFVGQLTQPKINR